MNKRRTVVVAFLLVACMIVGIGYATVSEKLGISGNATFVPSSYLGGQISSAIKFVAVEGTTGYTDSATFTENSGDMQVFINDIDSENKNTFTSTATYKVKYDTTDMSLATVSLAVNSSVKKTTDASQDCPGFTISVETKTEDGSAAKTELAPGESMLVIVTVTYDENSNPDAAEQVKGTINVGLTYTAINS